MNAPNLMRFSGILSVSEKKIASLRNAFVQLTKNAEPEEGNLMDCLDMQIAALEREMRKLRGIWDRRGEWNKNRGERPCSD